MPQRLKDKICVITGAARGIGRAAALHFAREGASVCVVDKDKQAGMTALNELRQDGGMHRFIETDVSSQSEVAALMETVRSEYGRLDVLYNNASVYLPGRDGPADQIKEDDWDFILAVNLKSIYLLCRFGIPLMLDSGGGVIINTASSAGLIGIPGCDAYTASKGATISLTRSLAVEYGPRGIRTNCIAPAGIMTEMMKVSNLDDDSFDKEHFLKLRAPLRRFGKPEEIADLAVFLASDESTYLNGAVMTADGGITVNGDLSKV